MIELHGRKYQRIGGVWHFYYPLKNGVVWHELINWAIKRELKAAEHKMQRTVGTVPPKEADPQPEVLPVSVVGSHQLPLI